MAECKLNERTILPDSCEGDCVREGTRCIATRKRRYLIFFKQAAACGCRPGRHATDEEHERLEEDFPNLPRWDYTVTGPATNDYNCFGWALCSRIYGRRVPRNVDDPLAWVDRLYTDAGWVRSGSCDPELCKRKIAIYCKDDVPTHAAKQLVGRLWSSKLGDLQRIVHAGTGALEGPVYGTVCRCYERTLQQLLADARRVLRDAQQLVALSGDPRFREIQREAEAEIRDLEQAIKRECGP